MKELKSKMIITFYNEIKSNKKKFKKSGTAFNLPISEEQFVTCKEQKIQDAIIEFYMIGNGFKANWDFDLKRNLCGRMNLSPLNYVLESWEEKLYYEGADERLKYFRPIDVFTEEACCGILIDGSGDPTMYYHDFGTSTIYSLDIDFKSYFDLSIDALVFLYWQTHLVDLVNGDQGVEILFRTGMKEVFPDFDLEEFTAKFEKMRLSKR